MKMLFERTATSQRIGCCVLIALCFLAQSCAIVSPSNRVGEVAPGRLKPALNQGANRGMIQRGEASWYGPGFRGKKTADGDKFDETQLVAAHKTFPLGSKAKVTNLKNGKTVEVQIKDRGPFVAGRIIDLSRAAAEALGMIGPGTIPVQVELLSGGGKSSTTSSRAGND